MALRTPRITRRSLFAICMAASAICLLLPSGWTSPLKHVAQLLVPSQDLLYSASHRAAKSISRLDAARTNDADAPDDLRAELASTAAALEQLLSENERLRSLRRDQVPPPTPVLPAKVVARDVASTRDSLLIARGSQRGVSSGDWLTTRFFINQGRASGVEEGQAVLAEHCMLGRVELTSPYMARVQLFSDVDSPRVEVRVGAMEKGRLRFVDYPCSLRGGGKQTMLIEGVDYRYVETDRETDRKDAKQRISVGDYVFSAPGQLGLPAPIVIGRVRRLTEDAKKRLVYNVEVEPIVQVEDLRDVYVIPLVPTSAILAKE